MLLSWKCVYQPGGHSEKLVVGKLSWKHNIWRSCA